MFNNESYSSLQTRRKSNSILEVAILTVVVST